MVPFGLLKVHTPFSVTVLILFRILIVFCSSWIPYSQVTVLPTGSLFTKKQIPKHEMSFICFALLAIIYQAY